MTTEATNTNEAPVKPTPGTPEYDAYMAAEYDRRTSGPSDDEPGVTPEPNAPEIPAKPEGGHDKFYDAKTGAYNWEAHAKEVEYRSKQGEKKDEAKADEAKAEDGKTDEAKADDVALDALGKAGLKMDVLRDQIVQNGKLDDTAIEALVTKAGLPKELVEDYVALAKFKLDTETSKAKDYAGGEEGWKALKDFAGKSMSPGEQAEVNRLLASEGWKLGIDMIKTRMNASSKTAGEPTLFDGDAGRQVPTGYRSRSEQNRDMQDPRYRGPRRDMTFVRMVEQKVASATYDLDR